MPAMRALGRSGITVGPLAFGSAAIGGLGHFVDESSSREALDEAIRVGIRYFDTAPLYGAGLAEQRLGLQLPPVPDLVLSTKVGYRLNTSSDGQSLTELGFQLADSDVFATHETSLRSLRSSLNDSRLRLGTHRPVVVLLHDPEPGDVDDGVFDFLEDLRQAGEIRSYGAGANSPGPLMDVIERTDSDVVLAARALHPAPTADARDLIALARLRRVSVVAAGIFSPGLEMPVELHRRLSALAMRSGIALDAVLLQYPLLATEVAAVLVGMRSPEEVHRNAVAISTPITDEFWRDVAGLEEEAGAVSLFAS